MRRLIATTLAAVLLLAAVSPALAARHHKLGIVTAAGVTLNVDPNPGVAGEPYTVSGSGLTGYDFGDGLLHVSKADPGCCAGFAVRPDASGSFSYTDIANGPGTYILDFLGTDDLGNVVTVGTITFAVVP